MTAAVAWKIHPAIGIARVGNSPTEFFIGPESPDRIETPAGGYRDAGDADNLHLPRVKRQAARFRIYAYDRAGKCLGEVTAQSVKTIRWTVQLANKKASGKRIGGGATLRNKHVPAGERWRLEIAPQPRELAGVSQKAVFDDGKFMDIPVCLGEIRTDADGRLLVLGGYGKAGTYDAAKRIKSCTDNDGWHDDVSDGPVSATITLLDGRVVSAAPGWVVVAPPNFAPGIASVATLRDALVDRAVGNGLSRASGRPSFRNDILPILRRIVSMQWLSRQALAAFGSCDLAALAQNGADGKAARELVFAALSKHDAAAPAERWLRLTRTQLDVLKLWAAGHFDADWSETAPAVLSPLSPETLDRAALELMHGRHFRFGGEFRDLPVRRRFPARSRQTRRRCADAGDALSLAGRLPRRQHRVDAGAASRRGADAQGV